MTKQLIPLENARDLADAWVGRLRTAAPPLRALRAFLGVMIHYPGLACVHLSKNSLRITLRLGHLAKVCLPTIDGQCSPSDGKAAKFARGELVGLVRRFLAAERCGSLGEFARFVAANAGGSEYSKKLRSQIGRALSNLVARGELAVTDPIEGLKYWGRAADAKHLPSLARAKAAATPDMAA